MPAALLTCCLLPWLVPTAGEPEPPEVLIHETFDEVPAGADLPEGWWVEGGQRVWVESGRLRMQADPPEGKPGFVCTAWYNRPVSGDVRVEVEAHCLSSATDANNINLFLFYSDPSGRPLADTQAARASADYKLYHRLNGNIVTFLNDAKGEGGRYPGGATKARLRLRRCPGFELLTETFDYHCQQHVTYRLTVVRRQGELTVAVNDHVFLRHTDPNPHLTGLIGLRTFRTDLWWDNLKVTRVD